jgi:transposase
VEQATGRWERGRIVPADRQHLAAWLGRFDGAGQVEFAMEGCTGRRYVAEEMRAARRGAACGGAGGYLGAAGAERLAKTDRADARLLRELLAAGRLPECTS